MQKYVSSFLATGFLLCAQPANTQEAPKQQDLDKTLSNCLDAKLPDFLPWRSEILVNKINPKITDGFRSRGRLIERKTAEQLRIKILWFWPLEGAGSVDSFLPVAFEGITNNLARQEATQKQKDGFKSCAALKTGNQTEDTGPYTLCVSKLYGDIAEGITALKTPEKQEFIRQHYRAPAESVQELVHFGNLVVVNVKYGLWPFSDYPVAFETNDNKELSNLYINTEQ